jgi:thymidylate synthase (FAD)
MQIDARKAPLMTEDELREKVLELRKTTFPALSDGFVRLVDATGGDAAVVEAARLTSDIKGRLPSDDAGLLRFLMRHRHSTPFEFADLKFHIRVPMDAWRQWIRHRTASVNEFSTRYSKAIDEKDVTKPGEWRLQSKGNRQGSSGGTVEEFPEGFEVPGEILEVSPNITPGGYLSEKEHQLHEHVAEVYQERLTFGVANEQSRKDLTLSTYTEAYWKMNLHNLLHFLGLRMDPHAQKEIRDFANIIGEQIMPVLFPATWQAFRDYRLDAMGLTALDIDVLQRVMQFNASQNKQQATVDEFMICQHPEWAGLKRCRERDECLGKLQRLGIVAADD